MKNCTRKSKCKDRIFVKEKNGKGTCNEKKKKENKVVRVEIRKIKNEIIRNKKGKKL